MRWRRRVRVVAVRDVARLHHCRRMGWGRECRGCREVLRMRCGWLGSGRGCDGDGRWDGSPSRFTPSDGGRRWRRAGVDELGMFKGEHVDDAPEVWPGLRSFATKVITDRPNLLAV
jgi:hypothetical protein